MSDIQNPILVDPPKVRAVKAKKKAGGGTGDIEDIEDIFITFEYDEDAAGLPHEIGRILITYPGIPDIDLMAEWYGGHIEGCNILEVTAQGKELTCKLVNYNTAHDQAFLNKVNGSLLEMNGENVIITIIYRNLNEGRGITQDVLTYETSI